MSSYILAVDQSTSGTKALLFDKSGGIVCRSDLPHEQKINEKGYVSHDPEEIYRNTIDVCRSVISESKIDPAEVIAVGISNQRESALVWDRGTGKPVADSVVWQCSRGEYICERLLNEAEFIKESTGLTLSPYFSAAKIAWLLENTDDIKSKDIAAGTMDSWLVYKLTEGKEFKTDFSNASRTQMFNINTLSWDSKVCALFGIDTSILPTVCDSDSVFGYTDIGGLLPKKIPIHSVMGDSHAALYGQGCHRPGMVKSTYGTGSSVMMNIGSKPVVGAKGLVTSLAWSMQGKTEYVLEGNINYTGSVIKWLLDDLGIISSSKESGQLALTADPTDKTYLVPAFSGLSAPYFEPSARAIICGMSRTTGKAEIVKAAEDCIAYQISDVLALMEQSGIPISELRVDGGPTRDKYLMKFQSDIISKRLLVSETEELSALGVAYCAGISAGIYDKDKIFDSVKRIEYVPSIDENRRLELIDGWHEAVKSSIAK